MNSKTKNIPYSLTDLEFSCCFCNQGIIESKTNPLDINIMHNIDILNKTGRGQSFYAHFDCLKERLHPYVQKYFFKFENEEVSNDENKVYSKIWSYLTLAAEICAQKIID